MIKYFIRNVREWEMHGNGIPMHFFHFEKDSPLVVKLHPQVWRHEYDLTEDVKEWLVENCGRRGIYYSWIGRERNLRFMYENDAMMFKLAWCG